MEAGYEVQRTIKRAELAAFLCLLKKMIGPITKELSMDHEKERKSVSSQEREMLICGYKIWEELHGLVERGTLVEVEQVEAQRTKKEKKR